MTRHEEHDIAGEVRLHAKTARLLGVDFLPVGIVVNGGAEAALPASAALESTPEETTGGRGDEGEKATRLAALRARHDAECPHCTNATSHSRTVFGDGSANAALMFIGEAPGAEEDRLGIPFVGRAGQKLNEMITAMGLRREDVYIANVLKARPPNNATPTPEEASRCGPYLAEQIEIIRPKVIVTLGKPAANYLLENSDSMSSMRGSWHAWRGIPVMPTFHPAYLLRAYTPENRRKVWSDLQQAMSRLGD